jgi:hypothetical protein
MNYINEIQNLQQRIIELEKQNKNNIDYEKETSVNYNLDKVKQIIEEKNKKIEKNNYGSKFYLNKIKDEEMIIYLQAIYNCLQIMNNKINDLEKKINS